MTRRLVALASVALMFLAIAMPAASAAPPKIDRWEDEGSWNLGSCGEFNLIQTDNVEATIKTFYNKDESVDRIHYHFTFEGFVQNSEDSSKNLPGVGHENAITDEDYAVWYQSGLYYRVKLPKGGVVLMDAGRFILDFSGGAPVFDWHGGNHQILEEDFDDICDALS